VQGVPPVQQPPLAVSTSLTPLQGQFMPQGHFQAGFDLQTSQVQAPLQPQVVAPLCSRQVAPVDIVKAKKSVSCWKCSVDSHAAKDYKAQHYCYICDKMAHPTVRYIWC
jgi:hypothetical protein